MSRANLSIIGMLAGQPDLLDDLQLPEDVDRETVTDAIKLETAELEIVYSNPLFMKSAIKAWSKRRLYAWTELYKTTQYEYEPLWNKDATITDTEEIERGQSIEGESAAYKTGTTSRTTSNTMSRNSAGTRGGTNLHEVTGFNSDELTTESKDTQQATDSLQTSGTDSEQMTGTDGESSSGSNSEDLTENITRTRTHRETGNIGITSAMDLIRQQREIVNFDIAQIIADEFKKQFCIMVY